MRARAPFGWRSALIASVLAPAVSQAQHAHTRTRPPHPGDADHTVQRNITLAVMEVRTAPLARPCLRPPVEIHRLNGRGTWTGSLTDCEGRPTVQALAALSALASPARIDTLPDLEPLVATLRRVAPAAGWDLAEDRPRARRALGPCPPGREPVSAPSTEVATGTSVRRGAHAAAHRAMVCSMIDVPHDPRTHDPLLLTDPHVRVLHPRLVAMLGEVTTHFAGHRVEVVSGYRPSSNPDAGSRHAHARAMDYRLAGISRETLRDFARTLPNAGVGYYPNSVFVHMDVRDPAEGSARWTDYSSQGETPRYGHWPPNDHDVTRETDFLVRQAEHALGALAHDDDLGADNALRERDDTNGATSPSTAPSDAPAAPSLPSDE